VSSVVRIAGDQEEGEYEWATYHNDGGKEQAHAEPAVLYTPLGGSNEDDGFEDEWRRIFIVGSRCEQYGGHWKGHKCVGIPSHKEDKKASCSAIATSVEAPYVWQPATWVPFAVGIGLCQIF
jgi:hypothetical protein